MQLVCSPITAQILLVCSFCRNMK